MISLTFRVIRDALLMGIFSLTSDFKVQLLLFCGKYRCLKAYRYHTNYCVSFFASQVSKFNGFFSIIIWMNLIIFQFVTSHVTVDPFWISASSRALVPITLSVVGGSSMRSFVTYGLLIHTSIPNLYSSSRGTLLVEWQWWIQRLMKEWV